jgi:hypothetical protein
MKSKVCATRARRSAAPTYRSGTSSRKADWSGSDQIKAGPLPHGLAGRGEVTVACEGGFSSEVKPSIKLGGQP